MSPARVPGRARAGRAGAVAAGLVIAVLALYAQVWRFQFVEIDDLTYVGANEHLRDGLTPESLRWCFNVGYSSNWHPLTWFTHALDVELFGGNAGGHHVGNVLLHAANAVLLFFLVRRLLGTGTGPRAAFWACALGAGLFALHPLRVESVAWVSERKDVLSTLFWLLTLRAYLWYCERPGAARMLAVTLCLALGLMAKPMLVTLPFVLLLLDAWPLRRVAGAGARGRLRCAGALLGEKLPLFLLAAASCALTLVAQARGGAVSGVDVLPLPDRLANAVVACAGYLLLWVWPRGLCVFYPHPLDSLSAGQVLAAAAVLLALSGAAWRLRRRFPELLVGWLWYLGTLAPVIGIVQVGAQALADRYTYVPQMGLVLALAGLLARLPEPARRRAFVAGGGALAILAVLTWRQVGSWRDSETLFRRALDVTTHNYFAHNNLGVALARQDRIEEAGEQFRAALADLPDYPYSLRNLGSYYERKNDPDAALAEYQKLLRYWPDHRDTRMAVARLLEQSQRYAEARAQYRAWSESHPDDLEALLGEGYCWIQEHRPVEARAPLQRAVALAPRSGAAHRLLGVALEQAGDGSAAEEEYRTALACDPGDDRAAEALGTSLLASGRPRDAIPFLEQVLRIRGDAAEPLIRLGEARLRAGDREEAARILERLQRLDPQAATTLRRLLEP